MRELPPARWNQEVEFTQPRAHLLADLRTWWSNDRCDSEVSIVNIRSFPGFILDGSLNVIGRSLLGAVRVVAADPGRRTEVVHVEVAPVVIAARTDLMD